MGKNIVVLTASARKQGNSNVMAAAFTKAAEARGDTVTVFDTSALNIRPCRDCKNCFKRDRPCCFDDDFNRIEPTLAAADAIVFVAPVYWFGMPASIKAVIDKFYTFFIGRQEVGGKRCALISTCGQTDPQTFDGLTFCYRRSTALLGWESVGEVLVGGMNELGAVKHTDGEARAAALAAKL